jgi:hypothetical protein
LHGFKKRFQFINFINNIILYTYFAKSKYYNKGFYTFLIKYHAKNNFYIFDVLPDRLWIVRKKIRKRYRRKYRTECSIQKPVLFPLNTASGTTLTRGYPLESHPWERADHPHHVGMWLNHGDVNGLDFWGHSDSIPRNRKPHYGTIYHKSIEEIENGDEYGYLEVKGRWERPDGRNILDENTKYYFRGTDNIRVVDRITTLTAKDLNVLFKDTKEGMMGIRVNRALELPEGNKIMVFDENLVPVEIDANDNRSYGHYLSSEGIVGGAVWGQRARWIRLGSIINNEKVGIVIMDHPDNPNHPTHWHARGYGLFSVNPLGSQTFTKGKETFNLFLRVDESVTFKYRVYIYNNTEPDSTAINLEYEKFANLFKN